MNTSHGIIRVILRVFPNEQINDYNARIGKLFVFAARWKATFTETIFKWRELKIRESSARIFVIGMYFYVGCGGNQCRIAFLKLISALSWSQGATCVRPEIASTRMYQSAESTSGLLARVFTKYWLLAEGPVIKQTKGNSSKDFGYSISKQSTYQ